MFDFISTEEVNCSRQPELDLAKGFAILFMVLCHTVMELGNSGTNVLGTLAISVLGGPLAAPVFMTSLGVGVCYSKNSTPEKLARRGVKTIGIALLLNFFRVVLPLTFVGILTGGFDWQFTAAVFVSCEILSFAGLSFILIALIKKLNLSNLQVVLIALIFALFGGLFTKGHELLFTSDIINAIVGIFVPTNVYTAHLLEFYHDGIPFPFCNWIIFPLAGFLFGRTLRKVTDKTAMYKLIFPVATALSLLFLFINMKYGRWVLEKGGYYHIGLLSGLFYLCVVFFSFSTCYFIKDFLPEKISHVLGLMSANIIEIFCLHWVILNWTFCLYTMVFGQPRMDNAAAYVVGLVIAAAATRIAVWWSDRKKARLQNC